MNNPNPNAKPEEEEGKAREAGRDGLKDSHRSINSQIEGGQNEHEGEPHPGYGTQRTRPDGREGRGENKK